MCGSDGVEFQIIPTKAEPDVSVTIPGRGRLTIPKKGIAKLFTAHREALAGVGSRGHFGCIIGPEAERIGAGVAV